MDQPRATKGESSSNPSVTSCPIVPGNLRHKQKALARKKKGCANRGEARRQLTALRERGANAHADFQHQLSSTLVE